MATLVNKQWLQLQPEERRFRLLRHLSGGVPEIIKRMQEIVGMVTNELKSKGELTAILNDDEVISLYADMAKYRQLLIDFGVDEMDIPQMPAQPETPAV